MAKGYPVRLEVEPIAVRRKGRLLDAVHRHGLGLAIQAERLPRSRKKAVGERRDLAERCPVGCRCGVAGAQVRGIIAPGRDRAVPRPRQYG